VSYPFEKRNRIRDIFQPDEMFISSGSDDKANLMFLPKLLEDFQPFSGRYLQGLQLFKIGDLEQ
jgi:hypothetical protein